MSNNDPNARITPALRDMVWDIHCDHPVESAHAEISAKMNES
jgi:hypothetical protein